ncbi:MAG: hypothetical protein ACM31O_03485 [Bacteroidota bacterium]
MHDRKAQRDAVINQAMIDMVIRDYHDKSLSNDPAEACLGRLGKEVFPGFLCWLLNELERRTNEPDVMQTILMLVTEMIFKTAVTCRFDLRKDDGLNIMSKAFASLIEVSYDKLESPGLNERLRKRADELMSIVERRTQT